MSKLLGNDWHFNTTSIQNGKQEFKRIRSSDFSYASYIRISVGPEGAGKVFASYTIYKGKAVLSAEPVLPKFNKLDSGHVKVDRQGVILLTFCPAIGEVTGEKRSAAGQVRKSLSIKPHADGTGYMVSLNVVDNIEKTSDRFVVPVTAAEFATLRVAASFALPHLLGWDRCILQSTQDVPENQQKMAPRLTDSEWNR
ncbi:hypothetical protein Leryth_013617 [Lithospermum erythrorhizon]|nr:hypothetical protein Leryth_013617 [Lithospermum erythrorhizon]